MKRGLRTNGEARGAGHGADVLVAPAVLSHLVDDEALQAPRQRRQVVRPDPVVGDVGAHDGEARVEDEQEEGQTGTLQYRIRSAYYCCVTLLLCSWLSSLRSSDKESWQYQTKLHAL